MIKRTSIPEAVTGVPQNRRHLAVPPGAKLTDGNQQAELSPSKGRSSKTVRSGKAGGYERPRVQGSGEKRGM